MVQNILFVNWGQLPQLCLFPTSCASPAYLLGWQSRKNFKQKKKLIPPQCCSSIVQLHLNHWCFINIVLITNPKHNTVQVAVKKIKLIPARSSTNILEFMDSILLFSEDYVG